MTRTLVCLLLGSCLLAQGMGCSSSASPDTSTGKLKMGMMPKIMGIEFFEAARQGAQEAADELGLELVYDGPTEARSEEQTRMIDVWLAQGIDILAVAPNDPEAIAQSLRRAKESGATVLTWDTDAISATSGRSMFVNQAPSDVIGAALVDLMAEEVMARSDTLGGST